MFEPVPQSQPWAALSISWNGADAWLHLRATSGELTVPLVGQVLRYRATNQRICLGYSKVGGGHATCTEVPDDTARHCQSCRIRNAGFAASLHHSHTKPKNELPANALEHLQQPNVLYLAAFRDGSLKVGTSTAARSNTRLIEQGAWIAQIVADADDGFVVREIEDHVTELLEVPQSVSIRRKLNALLAPLSDTELQAALQRPTRLTVGLIQRLADDRLRARNQSQTGIWRSPVADSPVWSRVHEYPFELGGGEHHVEVVGALGRVVALSRPGRSDDVFVADIGTLFGVWVEPAAVESEEIAIQDSLF